MTDSVRSTPAPPAELSEAALDQVAGAGWDNTAQIEWGGPGIRINGASGASSGKSTGRRQHGTITF